jgi:hypothetical protein
MNTKLTLTIDEAVIGQAKEYAKGTGRSLSDLVENYLKSVANDNVVSDVEITPLVRSLQGSFRSPGSADDKEELTKALSKKYRR